MRKLNNTAMAKAGSTGTFRVPRFGKWTAMFKGDTDSETLTLQHATAVAGTYTNVYAAGVLQSYSSTDDVTNFQNYELGGDSDMFFRYTMSNGAGTVGTVFVYVDGNVDMVSPSA